MKDHCSDNKSIITVKFSNIVLIVLALALLIRIFLIFNYGNKLSTYSDDRNYVFGAISFIKNNVLVYGIAWPEEHAMIIMPGILFLLRLLFQIFGYDQTGMLLSKCIFAIIGCFGIYGMYLIIEKTINRYVSLITIIILAIWPPLFLCDVLFLTQTPTTVSIIWFVYFVLRYCETKSDRDFILLMITYIMQLMFRNNFALIPIIFIFYFYHKKFPIKILITKGIYAVIILSLVLSPWCVRNYNVVGRFVPTTGGIGDPLLGGTFSGKYFPKSEMQMNDYRTTLYDAKEENSLYNRMEREKNVAIERLTQWWRNDKKSLAKDYLFYKPKQSIVDIYYPITLLDIEKTLLQKIYYALLILALGGAVIGIFRRKTRQIVMIFSLIIIYSIILCGLFLPYPEYNYPILPFLFTLSGYAIYEVYQYYVILKKVFLQAIKKEHEVN
ncbi:glycosyltransferase family 39 protein [Clostridium sp. YIM B02500]|uniref:glycosyltransferase family 39 protein n=1 Tax=Clostridium sp. YIM B02500 TaxID=2910681 RepID=UPI001EEEFF33|nr:glycosyltransferase family 39 protein [Clostridium sp. YIM B02500]